MENGKKCDFCCKNTKWLKKESKKLLQLWINQKQRKRKYSTQLIQWISSSPYII